MEDKIMAGLFDSLFDFNKDGKVDPFEKAAEFAAFESIMDDDDDEEKKTELDDLGLDIDDLDL